MFSATASSITLAFSSGLVVGGVFLKKYGKRKCQEMHHQKVFLEDLAKLHHKRFNTLYRKLESSVLITQDSFFLLILFLRSAGTRN